MTGPFIFIGTHRIKAGKFDEFKEDALALVNVVEEQEPRLLAFNFYLSEDHTEVSVVQIHPDAESMLHHMNVAREHITKGTEEQLETKQIQMYGPPNEAVIRRSKNSRRPASR
jgi:hypothetical protein